MLIIIVGISVKETGHYQTTYDNRNQVPVRKAPGNGFSGYPSTMYLPQQRPTVYSSATYARPYNKYGY